jgi:hypothetical protein
MSTKHIVFLIIMMVWRVKTQNTKKGLIYSKFELERKSFSIEEQYQIIKQGAYNLRYNNRLHFFKVMRLQRWRTWKHPHFNNGTYMSWEFLLFPYQDQHYWRIVIPPSWLQVTWKSMLFVMSFQFILGSNLHWTCSFIFCAINVIQLRVNSIILG